ncbi:MAG: glycerol-3-phosphate dehydrogenase/oxidase [Rhizobiales bacterium]|nr:glycerol-3-phosphate dehydrogenase/oxidase [Hyphomicrobiales bacterium]
MSARETARPDLIQALRQKKHVPVLIVGGGINGVGTFRDLSLQGVECLLVERGDFCSGASRAPSRMIHGGLKYLETGEFRLVRESATERNRLLENAPHYVAPLEMIIPIYSWFGGSWAATRKFFRLPAKMTERGALVIKLGLWLYDVYGAFNRAVPRHRMIARQDMLREIPDMDPGIRLAASYYDAWIISPERLVVELALDGMAAHPDSMALNHMRFLGVVGNEVELEDTTSGETFRLTCDILVNAAGAWIDKVNTAAAAPARRMIGGTRGSHLMLDLPALAETLHGRMIYFEAEGGRICILSNFMGHVLLGSTDVPVDDPEGVICEDSEVDYLLAAFRRVFPDVPVARSDIFFSYAGVRPLPAGDASDPGAISRDHSLPELAPAGERRFPILSLVGGKWTTFRAFSAEVTDAVLARLGKSRRVTTESTPIGGGVGLSQAAAPTERLLSAITREHGLTRSRAQQLVTRYGARASGVAAALAGGEHRLAALPEFSREEIAYVCASEFVETAEDFLFGRTSVFLERPLGHAALKELVAVIGDLRGWDSGRRAREVDALVARYARVHRIDISEQRGERPQFI